MDQAKAIIQEKYHDLRSGLVLKIRESQTNPKVALIFTVLISIVTIVFIIVYGNYRCNHPEFTDPIQLSPFGTDPQIKAFLDGWGLLHFFFHFIVAALFPHKEVMAFLVGGGVAWEIVECLNHEYPFYMTDCPAMIETDQTGNKIKHKWWYGRWQDVVMNTAGMLAGYGLRKHVIDKKILEK